jgi:hypothetical protein
MEDNNKRHYSMVFLWSFIGLLACIGGFLLMWWGAYVSCTDGGGHLHSNVPFIVQQCIGFYIQDDPRLMAHPMINSTTNLTPNIGWDNITGLS